MSTAAVYSYSPVQNCYPVLQKVPLKAIQEKPSHISGVGNLRAIAAIGDRIAWVGGTEGKIAKTENGGNTWSLCSLPYEKELDVRALWLMNSKVACAMCAGPGERKLSRIYRTIDGGKTWTLVLSPEWKGIFFNAMSFWNDREGIVLSDPVDGRFVLFQTHDGGETWKKILPIEMPFALPGETAFAASNSCLIVWGKEHVWFATGGGPMARVFYSTDRGRSWNVATTPMKVNSSSSGIFSLAFLDDQTGIAVGGDHQLKTSFPSPNILVTKDGGRNWQAAYDQALFGKYLSAVSCSGDGTWKVVDASEGLFNALAFTEKTGYVVGPNQAWAKISTP